MKIIGREKEQCELKRLYESGRSEFLMVYGRRRVGKTFLIREFFKNHFDFYATGIARGTKKEQLMNFRMAIASYNDEMAPNQFENWFEAFKALKQLLEKTKSKRKVVFLDELPWMDTPKSDFVKALEHFWNTWASARDDIMIIVCGSAASWMVKNIVKNHGGLHNRITFKMKVMPFNLIETKAYLHSKGVRWENNMIAECYMILGGIPYYLDLIDKNKSLAQNIDQMFFDESPLLENEFQNLFESLFRKSAEYINIVETLARKKNGYTREDIMNKARLSDGGGLTRRLEELEQCGFIRKYKTIGDVLFTYQLVDFFTVFYFSFLKDGKTYDSNNWMHFMETPKYNNWKGLAFERLCMAHLQQVKNKLGISGVSTNTYSLYKKEAQIDMVIERGDNIVNLCEMKYADEPFVITKNYAEKLVNKTNILKASLKKQRGIYLAFISSMPIKQNEYSINMVNKNIILDDLFKDVN